MSASTTFRHKKLDSVAFLKCKVATLRKILRVGVLQLEEKSKIYYLFPPRMTQL